MDSTELRRAKMFISGLADESVEAEAPNTDAVAGCGGLS